MYYFIFYIIILLFATSTLRTIQKIIKTHHPYFEKNLKISNHNIFYLGIRVAEALEKF